MKKSLLASAGALSLIGLAASAPAFGQEMMAHAYEVTVTNSMPTEFIAPVLVTGTDHDGAIFANHYVTPEAEAQVLTGDPAKLAARIGSDATVAHSDGGAPGVLLAPGKSLTFKVETAAEEIRVFAMVAPTEKPDNYLTATVKLAPMDDKMDSMAMSKDTMAKDAMAKDAMVTGSMAKDTMAKDEMMAEPMMIPSGRALRVGSRGKRVAMLRERLGVKAMETDPSVFDSALKSAVMDYQTKVGLAADGVVGPMTLKSLNSPPMEDAMAKDETIAKDTMAEGAMKKDAMAKDTMAEAAMAKDAMAKDSMAKDDMMMEDGGMSAALHRFDIGHDENTKTITEIDGTFGTVTVKAL
ncbi:MAG TPA: peptidoglycan-binding protein [Afifellaceae bacterium]|nr:peptidoglycan-binding protein [Afifellaceae bacterium]